MHSFQQTPSATSSGSIVVRARGCPNDEGTSLWITHARRRTRSHGGMAASARGSSCAQRPVLSGRTSDPLQVEGDDRLPAGALACLTLSASAVSSVGSRPALGSCQRLRMSPRLTQGAHASSAKCGDLSLTISYDAMVRWSSVDTCVLAVPIGECFVDHPGVISQRCSSSSGRRCRRKA
jgi:hypothetical protein